MKAVLTIMAVVIIAVAGLLLWSVKTNAPTTSQPTSTLSVISLENFSPGTVAQSPLTLSGVAPGPWYFEASFPVRVQDEEGNVLGVGIAQAQEDWMQEGPVPFKVTIEFEQPTTQTGLVVFQKDNPSGLPEFDAQETISVRFE